MSDETRAAEADVDGSEAASVADTVEAIREGREKRKTSRRLRDLQTMERGFGKAAHRLAKAMETGVSTYRERSEQSAEKEEDGALWDMPRNAAEGMSATLREASRLPVDLVEAVDVPTTRRLARFGTRLLMLPFGR